MNTIAIATIASTVGVVSLCYDAWRRTRGYMTQDREKFRSFATSRTSSDSNNAQIVQKKNIGNEIASNTSNRLDTIEKKLTAIENDMLGLNADASNVRNKLRANYVALKNARENVYLFETNRQQFRKNLEYFANEIDEINEENNALVDKMEKDVLETVEKISYDESNNDDTTRYETTNQIEGEDNN